MGPENLSALFLILSIGTSTWRTLFPTTLPLTKLDMEIASGIGSSFALNSGWIAGENAARFLKAQRV